MSKDSAKLAPPKCYQCPNYSASSPQQRHWLINGATPPSQCKNCSNDSVTTVQYYSILYNAKIALWKSVPLQIKDLFSKFWAAWFLPCISVRIRLSAKYLDLSIGCTEYLNLNSSQLQHLMQLIAGTRFLNFSIKCLRENEKVRETVLACSYWAQIESFEQSNQPNSVPAYTSLNWRTWSKKGPTLYLYPVALKTTVHSSVQVKIPRFLELERLKSGMSLIIWQMSPICRTCCSALSPS